MDSGQLKDNESYYLINFLKSKNHSKTEQEISQS